MINDSNNTNINGSNSKDVVSKEELINYILSLYNSGKTMLEIAKDIGRSKIFVSKIIHQFFTDEEIKNRQYEKLRGKHKLDFSKYKSSSGIYRVSFVENKRNGNDYWSYQYYEDGRLRRIVSVNLYKLKIIVLEKGLKWIEFTDEASELVLKYKETYDDSSLERYNKTGFFRVTKRKTNTKQGFTWAYSFKENNQLNFVSSVDISKLKSKVLANGWEWVELNEEASKLVEENLKKVQNRS
ncbi:hypothetical protein SAMN02910297_01832 [Methanobrevibacter olleyae]|uniref:Uncharacterized protein n=1 Tax=Methanobrevibacter olleyae TaxID=294671 RepID=A0A1I4KTL1_METOL|nr:hypothetical protein [Methanobrevibacter olleyae]SFL82075.1 hypothetical protein SAMN02910297_01832 [Methanobrevibacter olleyae]